MVALLGSKKSGEHTAFIVGVAPVSLGLVEAPGNYGADIVVGEGQALGSPITYGGPLYGIFACTKAYLRQMPGRIVGRSIDVDGKEAFCLTLSTREQHIRRHRATSNICTNETLIALMGAMHIITWSRRVTRISSKKRQHVNSPTKIINHYNCITS